MLTTGLSYPGPYGGNAVGWPWPLEGCCTMEEALLRMWRACCGGDGAAGASVGLSGRRRGSPGSSSAGGGGQGTARAAAAGLTRAGTVVGYLRSSPLADSGGRLNGGGGSAETSPQPLFLMPRSSGVRARQRVAQTEHL